MEEQYNSVRTAIENGLSLPYFRSLQNFDQSLQFLLKAAKEKLRTIIPIQRSRRGIFNGLGSVIKIISGNLDHEDAQRYDAAIATLQHSQENIVSQVNQRMSLNIKIMESFNHTISLITHNEETIENEANKINSELNKFMFDFTHFLQARNVLDQLNLALQVILQILNDLEVAITFAKTNTLHNSLIKPDELKWAVKKMLEHYSEIQLPYIYEEDIPKYYDIINIDGYFSNHTMVFILHFPILSPEIFTYFHLFSIPTTNHTTIIPPAPYLALSENFFQYTEVPCRKINFEYLCQEGPLQNNNQDCISQILQLSNSEATCRHVPVSINTTLIQDLSDAHYIAIFPRPTKVSTRCPTTKIMILEGVFLISLPPGCEFRTSSESFSNEKTVIQEEPLTLPKIHTKNDDRQPQVKPLKLSQVPLDELHKLIRTEEHLEPIQAETQSTNHSHFWITPLYILGTIMVIVICYKLKQRWNLRSKRNSNKNLRKEAKPEEEDPTVLFVPYKTSPGKGEITDQ